MTVFNGVLENLHLRGVELKEIRHQEFLSTPHARTQLIEDKRWRKRHFLEILLCKSKDNCRSNRGDRYAITTAHGLHLLPLEYRPMLITLLFEERCV